MSNLLERKEQFSFSLALLNKLYNNGVFNEEERNKIAIKLAEKYGFKSTSIIVSKSLITTLINESICIEKGSENRGN